MGCMYVCVLDLRQAYASVPRGDLIGRLYSVLSKDLASMLEAPLVHSTVTTIGDEQ